MRLEKGHVRAVWHRWQHLYALPLYGLTALSNRIGDVVTVLSGRYGDLALASMTAVDWAVFVGGKCFFFAYQVLLPLLFGVPPGRVAIHLAASDYFGSIYLGMVFACSHVAEGLEFVKDGGGRCWAEDQMRTTQDYGHGRLVTSLLTGNLSLQAEHHLFPGLSQFYYPSLTGEVKRISTEHDVPFLVRPSMYSAVGSHLCYLKRMGRED